jgi:hypothetical protein
VVSKGQGWFGCLFGCRFSSVPFISFVSDGHLSNLRWDENIALKGAMRCGLWMIGDYPDDPTWMLAGLSSDRAMGDVTHR